MKDGIAHHHPGIARGVDPRTEKGEGTRGIDAVDQKTDEDLAQDHVKGLPNSNYLTNLNLEKFTKAKWQILSHLAVLFNCSV